MTETTSEEARPALEVGRALFTLRITKPDGSFRDVPCEANISPARILVNEPPVQEAP